MRASKADKFYMGMLLAIICFCLGLLRIMDEADARRAAERETLIFVEPPTIVAPASQPVQTVYFEPEPEEPAQKPAGLNPAILLAVLALMGGGGAFAYFKLVKNKPKTKGNDNLDDYDYGEDDTDQEDEDSWETEESDELDADGGGDEESEDKTV